MPPSDDLRAVFQEMLRDGRRIEAIKLFREKTGCSLAKAKEALESLEAGLAPEPPPFLPLTPAARLEEQVLAVLADRGRIPAIEFYRKATHAGLKEAKDAVEAIEARHVPHTAPPRNQGCLSLLLLLALLVATLVLLP